MTKAAGTDPPVEESLLRDSRRAVVVLTQLIAKLEDYTNRVEDELARREAQGGDNAGRRPDQR